MDSESHWIDKIQKNFEAVEIEGFVKAMDIDRKGYVSVEDLVRFVNVESDQYFRNRDLVLIYKRLCAGEGEATKNTIKQELCFQWRANDIVWFSLSILHNFIMSTPSAFNNNGEHPYSRHSLHSHGASLKPNIYGSASNPSKAHLQQSGRSYAMNSSNVDFNNSNDHSHSDYEVVAEF